MDHFIEHLAIYFINKKILFNLGIIGIFYFCINIYMIESNASFSIVHLPYLIIPLSIFHLKNKILANISAELISFMFIGAILALNVWHTMSIKKNPIGYLLSPDQSNTVPLIHYEEYESNPYYKYLDNSYKLKLINDYKKITPSNEELTNANIITEFNEIHQQKMQIVRSLWTLNNRDFIIKYFNQIESILDKDLIEFLLKMDNESWRIKYRDYHDAKTEFYQNLELSSEITTGTTEVP